MCPYFDEKTMYVRFIKLLKKVTRLKHSVRRAANRVRNVLTIKNANALMGE